MLHCGWFVLLLQTLDLGLGLDTNGLINITERKRKQHRKNRLKNSDASSKNFKSELKKLSRRRWHVVEKLQSESKTFDAIDVGRYLKLTATVPPASL